MMKLKGSEIGRYKGIVHIVRQDDSGELIDYQIRVEQLPASWDREANKILPEPVPPIVGKIYERGQEIPNYNHEDPKYVEAHQKWQERRAAKKIYDATKDENITWEADPKVLETDPPAFYDAVYAELDAAFSGPEINTWLLNINSIGMVGGADIALQEESLLQAVLGLIGVPQLEESQG